MPTSSREDFVNGLIGVKFLAAPRLKAPGTSADHSHRVAVTGQRVGTSTANTRTAARHNGHFSGGSA